MGIPVDMVGGTSMGGLVSKARYNGVNSRLELYAEDARMVYGNVRFGAAYGRTRLLGLLLCPRVGKDDHHDTQDENDGSERPGGCHRFVSKQQDHQRSQNDQ